MGREYILSKLRVIDKLQRPPGYHECRIRPHPNHQGGWIAERYTTNQLSARKSWKPLLLEETNATRTFDRPEDAELALIDARGEPFPEVKFPLFVQSSLGIPEEQLWRSMFKRKEHEAPGSLEAMIEDAATRLAAAMRELRQCHSQTRANQLYEIIAGQSNRLSFLSQFINQEAKSLPWLKVNPSDAEPPLPHS